MVFYTTAIPYTCNQPLMAPEVLSCLSFRDLCNNGHCSNRLLFMITSTVPAMTLYPHLTSSLVGCIDMPMLGHIVSDPMRIRITTLVVRVVS